MRGQDRVRGEGVGLCADQQPLHLNVSRIFKGRRGAGKLPGCTGMGWKGILVDNNRMKGKRPNNEEVWHRGSSI